MTHVDFSSPVEVSFSCLGIKLAAQTGTGRAVSEVPADSSPYWRRRRLLPVRTAEDPRVFITCSVPNTLPVDAAEMITKFRNMDQGTESLLFSS